MSEQHSMELFGRFNNIDVVSVVDRVGKYWFTQEVIARALDIDRTTVSKIRENHSEEFDEDDDYTAMVIDGKRRTVFSEEGFLTICDMSTSAVAYRLRKWMRQQFKIRHEGREIVVRAKTLAKEDFSDVGQDLVMMQHMLSAIAEDRRRIKKLEIEQVAMAEEARELQEKVQDHEARLAVWEGGAKVRPGEMTAVQLAQHCRWISRAGAPHNLAVILAATNLGFAGTLMQKRREEGPGGMTVEVDVFTPQGVSEFLSRIDSQYNSGQSFTIAPTQIAASAGYKNNRYVFKQ